MIDVDLHEAIKEQLDTLSYDVSYPNVKFEPTSDEYLKVNYIYSRSESFTYGSDKLPTIVQIDVVVRDGNGAIDAGNIIAELRTLFPKNTKLTHGQSKFRINKQPFSVTALNVNGWYATPVSIPIEAYL